MISGIIGIFMLMFLAIIGLLASVFWIWMMIDAIQNKGLTDGEKIAWVLVVVFLHFLGAPDLLSHRPSEAGYAGNSDLNELFSRTSVSQFFGMAIEKRWRATAVQDAGAFSVVHGMREASWSCASPLALFMRVKSAP